MEIASLLALKRAPISSLAFPFLRVNAAIGQIDSNVFLLFTKFGQNLSILAEPEVTTVVWATSLGALRRVFDLAIEADEETVLMPPREMTFGVAARYADILAACKERWPSSIFETASYRIASDGKLICKNIETRGVAFHFRQPGHDDNEVPFVIKHKLTEG